MTRFISIAFLALALGVGWFGVDRVRAEHRYRRGQMLDVDPRTDVPGRLEAYLLAVEGGGTDGVPELRVGELLLRRAGDATEHERTALVGDALDALDRARRLRPLDVRVRIAFARALDAARLREAADEERVAALLLAPRHPGAVRAAVPALLRAWSRSGADRELLAALRGARSMAEIGEGLSPLLLVRELQRDPTAEIRLVRALQSDAELGDFVISWLSAPAPDVAERLERDL